MGPLTWVFNLFRCDFGCCFGGCGETYWGDWGGDPPDCCEPCDRCGNFTGGVPAGYGAYPVGGQVVPSAPGGCSECAQAQAAPNGAQRIVSQTDRAVPSPAAPAVAPRQAWRPTRPGQVPRYR